MFSRASAFLAFALAVALPLYTPLSAVAQTVPTGGFTPLAGKANLTNAFLANVAAANPIRLPMARVADFLDANAAGQSIPQALWSTSNLARKLNPTTQNLLWLTADGPGANDAIAILSIDSLGNARGAVCYVDLASTTTLG